MFHDENVTGHDGSRLPVVPLALFLSYEVHSSSASNGSVKMSELPRHVENDLLLLQPYTFFHADVLLKALHENRSRLEDDFPTRVGESLAKADVERFIEQKYVEWQRGEVFCFGIWHKPSGEYIGEISLKYADRSIPCGEFSYFVVRENEGRGYMTSSIQLLLPFAFDSLHLGKLQLR
jgi:RimJ/RimL family protein N-acetyltransferase